MKSEDLNDELELCSQRCDCIFWWLPWEASMLSEGNESLHTDTICDVCELQIGSVFVVVSSSEIIQFDWLALTSFLPCSWPSFTSWLCSISPSLPLGRATLPSLVRTHGSPGKSIYPSVITPLRITSSKHPCHFREDQGCLHSLRVYRLSHRFLFSRNWLCRDIHIMHCCLHVYL